MSNPPEVPASLAGQPIPESLLNTFITTVNTQDANQAAPTLLAMVGMTEQDRRRLVYSLRGAMSMLFDRQDNDTAARLLAAIERLSTRLAEPWALALYHYSQGQFDYNIARDY